MPIEHSLKDAAALLGRTTASVRHLIERGALVSSVFAGRRYVSATSVNAYREAEYAAARAGVTRRGRRTIAGH